MTTGFRGRATARRHTGAKAVEGSRRQLECGGKKEGRRLREETQGRPLESQGGNSKAATWAQAGEGSRRQVKARRKAGGYGRRQRDDRWSPREGGTKAASWAQVSEGSRRQL
jgi:hypothetical protein